MESLKNRHIKKIIFLLAKYKIEQLNQEIIISSIFSLENQLTEVGFVELRNSIKAISGDIDELEYSSLTEFQKRKFYDEIILKFSNLLDASIQNYRSVVVDNIVACEAITELVNYLITKGGVILKQKVTNVDSEELLLDIGFENQEMLEIEPKIDGIIKCDDLEFYCECHWSKVSLQKIQEF